MKLFLIFVCSLFITSVHAQVEHVEVVLKSESYSKTNSALKAAGESLFENIINCKKSFLKKECKIKLIKSPGYPLSLHTDHKYSLYIAGFQAQKLFLQLENYYLNKQGNILKSVETIFEGAVDPRFPDEKVIYTTYENDLFLCYKNNIPGQLVSRCDFKNLKDLDVKYVENLTTGERFARVIDMYSY